MTAVNSHGGLVGTEPLRVLLVEDDPGDAFLVEELLRESEPAVSITLARTLREALELFDAKVQCILVDLALPDAQGLDTLRQVLAKAPGTAVLVLTGLSDVQLGVAVVSAGAQDYLVKQDVDGALLTRAIRYAIERKRADESEKQLVEARAVSRENSRLERGLLPVPILNDVTLRHHARYRPGRARALLGGDFYDTVETGDGSVHMVIGDVSGHGADEASLGVRLRMAWRTLVLAGLGGETLLGTLDAVLRHERWSEEIFTTLCMLTIAPDRRSAEVYRAGHPRPLFFDSSGVHVFPDEPSGPGLGLLPECEWPTCRIELGESWALMLYTDGLIEGCIGDGNERLDLEGLVSLAEVARGRGDHGFGLIDGLISEAERLNGGVLSDDLAVLLMSRGDGR
ncbi:SpoIIE family protein phosphatase [Actinomadura barringtoniae]|uniref:SpoIIE family protein phosphatase n=1 Tax=Actinomadura barringtoniae TaxID=1427535 RepID=A0A939PAR1_9ACTN|nr:SpoIIE family protein phosphatase [Actinomadura barringtoniae]MBO2449120.1 SpoIIE family protein phosphatase [Actinomadura barringtoniae]